MKINDSRCDNSSRKVFKEPSGSASGMGRQEAPEYVAGFNSQTDLTLGVGSGPKEEGFRFPCGATGCFRIF